MNLYIDVDGVLLHQNEDPCMLKLLTHIRGLFDNVYWLSCWTFNGKTEELYKRHPSFKSLKATPLKWDKLKTDAIDWSKPFVWMEDGITKEERKVFEEKAVEGQQIFEIRNSYTGKLFPNRLEK